MHITVDAEEEEEARAGPRTDSRGRPVVAAVGMGAATGAGAAAMLAATSSSRAAAANGAAGLPADEGRPPGRGAAVVGTLPASSRSALVTPTASRAATPERARGVDVGVGDASILDEVLPGYFPLSPCSLAKAE